VLPVTCRIDEDTLGSLTLSSPLNEIVTLGRRMLGDDQPDKERELSDDDLDAVGEVLNLMSGAVDQVLREQVNVSLHCQPLPWWRTPEPGDNQFEEGEFLLAKGSVSVPGAPVVQLFLRLPPALLEQAAEVQGQKRNGRVLLLGLEEEVRRLLTKVLEAALMDVETLEAGAAELGEASQTVDIILMAEGDEVLDLCRQMRLANHSWTLPTVLCMREPTKDRVVDAIEAGASYVLGVPAEETTVLRVLNLASSRLE
jgi:chemotaxis protein CheY-P-specific phosphatase CheC